MSTMSCPFFVNHVLSPGQTRALPFSVNRANWSGHSPDTTPFAGGGAELRLTRSGVFYFLKVKT
jgi:hypothetical protein